MTTVSIYNVTSTRPGRTPAAKSRPIDCSAIIPYRMKPVLGGISIPSVPPAAILPVERPVS